MDAKLQKGFFQGRTFAYARANGTVITKQIVLSAGGKIERYSHPNESSWDIKDSKLVFMNAANEVTTEFDTVRIDGTGHIFEGRHLLGAGQRHTLTECVVEIKKPALIAKDADPAPSGANSVAILVRSHKVDRKFDDLIVKLGRTASNYDVYPIVDETRGRPSIRQDRAIWHSVEASRDLGLTQPRQDLMQVCGDFPFYFALRDLPRYRLYVMIEDDVDFIRADAHFIEQLVGRLASPQFSDVDFVGLQFRQNTEKSGWFEACRKLFPKQYCYFSYFPFVALSRRAAAFLFSQRQLEAARQPQPRDVVHCEAFVASCAMAGGFRCIDLNEIIPGSYELKTMGMQLGGLAVGKPMGFPVDVAPGIEIIHPIYTPEEFVNRAYRKFVLERKGDWQNLIRFLEGPEAAAVPPHLIDELRAKIPTAPAG
jgi:hypothetical protein